jgi:hypothetical protein
MLVTEPYAKQNMWCPMARVRWKGSDVAYNRVNMIRRNRLFNAAFRTFFPVCIGSFGRSISGAWVQDVCCGGGKLEITSGAIAAWQVLQSMSDCRTSDVRGRPKPLLNGRLPNGSGALRLACAGAEVTNKPSGVPIEGLVLVKPLTAASCS